MKKYRSNDGSYLIIDENHRAVLRIGWYLPEDDDIGAFLGDRELTEVEGETDEDKKMRWEITVATTAAAPFAIDKGITSLEGFEFETMKQAKLALIAANTALLNGGAPMPEWAVKAMEAGWTPPKGWKP